ncbi:hypothetical protein [Qipengyuania flava]|uniref:hypothetical protein n=1 Tax=Qipengyuania flava TaxID=192812 RepID=UPI001C637974|nr:hypothetical protein [Qipengyuania flava]QYJ06427.1 hypothetical protein KUV82_10120 [Qipengyuania flava]
MKARLTGLLALAIPVLAGIAYLELMGAPASYAILNAAAFGVAAVFGLFAPPLPSIGKRRVITVVLIALIFLPLITGPYVNGIARWLPLGPFTLHSGALFLPALVVLAARDEDFAPPILLAALLAATLQPDAATSLAVMLAAVGIYTARDDWRMVPVAGIAFFASLVAGLRGELPAQPFVERILVHLAFEAPVGALALAGALLATFFLLAHALAAEKSVRHGLAGAFFGFCVAALVSNYPTILVGYGAAPILGFGLAIGLAAATARRTANDPTP